MRTLLTLVLAALIISSTLSAGDEAPPPSFRVKRNDLRHGDWLVAIDRLRSMPEPGELDSGPLVDVHLADVLKFSDEDKKKIAQLQEAYNVDRLKKIMEWENELKNMRDAHEARLIEALPAELRDKSRKLLSFAHSRWVSNTEREHKFRVGFLKEREKWKNIDPKNREQLDEARESLQAWTQGERNRNIRDDAETLLTIKGLLTPEEGERLEHFNRTREAPHKPESVQPEKK